MDLGDPSIKCKHMQWLTMCGQWFAGYGRCYVNVRLDVAFLCQLGLEAF